MNNKEKLYLAKQAVQRYDGTKSLYDTGGVRDQGLSHKQKPGGSFDGSKSLYVQQRKKRPQQKRPLYVQQNRNKKKPSHFERARGAAKNRENLHAADQGTKQHMNTNPQMYSKEEHAQVRPGNQQVEVDRLTAMVDSGEITREQASQQYQAFKNKPTTTGVSALASATPPPVVGTGGGLAGSVPLPTTNPPAAPTVVDNSGYRPAPGSSY